MRGKIPRMCGRVFLFWVVLLTFLDLVQGSNGQKKRVTWSESINSYTKSLNTRMQRQRTRNYPGSVNEQVEPKLKPAVFPGNPLAYMTPMEMIQMYGYKGEAHLVVTADGYILTTFRILPNTMADKFRGPIFLQHGFVSSAMEWFFNTKENLVALQLSDAGYDVWIGNARGSTYSRGHVNTSISDNAYWEFSVNEFGKYDLPAGIDYILAKTGQTKLSYIGFSMGATSFFVMMSHHPEYNDKVKVMIALAPVVYLTHMSSPSRILTLMTDYPIIQDVIKLVAGEEIIPFGLGPLSHLFQTKFCGYNDGYNLTYTICALVINIFTGFTTQTDHKQTQIMTGHAIAPFSLRSGMHLLQFIKPGIFREFDFGKVKNKKYYGKSTPPLYDLKKTTTPVAIFYGKTDGFMSKIDVDRLANELPNVVSKSEIDAKYFNHIDIQASKNQRELLNNHVLKILEEY